MDKVSYPVYRGPIIVGLIVICCFVWWWWRCPCRCYQTCGCPNVGEVIIDPDCVAKPEEVHVGRGDQVVWTNLLADTLTLKFTTGTPFAVDSLWIPPGHQMTMKVEDDATIKSYDYVRAHIHNGETLSCEGGATGPKVNVGGGGG